MCLLSSMRQDERATFEYARVSTAGTSRGAKPRTDGLPNFSKAETMMASNRR